MTHHLWWDKDWDYWADLGNAKSFIYKYVYNTAYCRIIMKEKYGTIRYEYMFTPIDNLRIYRFPFYLHLPYPKNRFGGPKYCWHIENSRVNSYWRRYAHTKLDEAVKIACKKWPHIKDEILADYWNPYE